MQSEWKWYVSMLSQGRETVYLHPAFSSFSTLNRRMNKEGSKTLYTMQCGVIGTVLSIVTVFLHTVFLNGHVYIDQLYMNCRFRLCSIWDHVFDVMILQIVHKATKTYWLINPKEHKALKKKWHEQEHPHKVIKWTNPHLH